jgi:hypothetical protein
LEKINLRTTSFPTNNTVSKAIDGMREVEKLQQGETKNKGKNTKKKKKNGSKLEKNGERGKREEGNLYPSKKNHTRS